MRRRSKMTIHDKSLIQWRPHIDRSHLFQMSLKSSEDSTNWKVPTHQTTVWLSPWCADSRKPSDGLLLNDSSTKLTPCQHEMLSSSLLLFYSSTLMIPFNVRDQNKLTTLASRNMQYIMAQLLKFAIHHYITPMHQNNYYVFILEWRPKEKKTEEMVNETVRQSEWPEVLYMVGTFELLSPL